MSESMKEDKEALKWGLSLAGSDTASEFSFAQLLRQTQLTTRLSMLRMDWERVRILCEFAVLQFVSRATIENELHFFY
jgi:hypothetical protein